MCWCFATQERHVQERDNAMLTERGHRLPAEAFRGAFRSPTPETRLVTGSGLDRHIPPSLLRHACSSQGRKQLGGIPAVKAAKVVDGRVGCSAQAWALSTHSLHATF